MELGGHVYKVFGIVTNLIGREAVIRWYRERCGKSEEVHRNLKEDLASDVISRFGSNAFWWNVSVAVLCRCTVC